ncbi:hypothetical protein BSKO_10399 [Bryopsis sp. KO-2023]|nr:hypothetical protein BSKO_10399 [Bryopsis sp. KO-2023]
MGDTLRACPVCETFFSESELQIHVASHFDEEERAQNREADSSVESRRALSVDPGCETVACVICGEQVPLKNLNQHEEQHRLESVGLVPSSSTIEVVEVGLSTAGGSGQQIRRGKCFYCKEEGHWKSECPLAHKYNDQLSEPIEPRFSTITSLQVADQQFIPGGNIIGYLSHCFRNQRYTSLTYLCGATQHFSGTFGDRGWGCGWRNAQMLASHLLQRADFPSVLFGGCKHVPSISFLQAWLECAWDAGFDVAGRNTIKNGKVQGTTTWIGTTEVTAMLRQFRVNAQVVDFLGANSIHNTERNVDEGTFHQGVICDGCRSEITGVRHKSLSWPNFDLCGHCVQGEVAGNAAPFEISGLPARHQARCSLCNAFHFTGVLYTNPTSTLCQDCYLTLAPPEKSTFKHHLSRTLNPDQNAPKKNARNWSSHEKLVEWVWGYFSDGSGQTSGVVETNKPPLYFQHSGHSRTIVGIEKNGNSHSLVVLDPGTPAEHLRNAIRAGKGWQQLVKRGLHTLKKPEYQLICVDGLIQPDAVHRSKTIEPLERIFS